MKIFRRLLWLFRSFKCLMGYHRMIWIPKGLNYEEAYVCQFCDYEEGPRYVHIVSKK